MQDSSAPLHQAPDSVILHASTLGAASAPNCDVPNLPTPSLVGVIWDLDGTLADTEQAHFRAWQEICTKYAHGLSWEEFKPTFGLGNPDILRLLIADDLSDDDVQRLSDEKEALFRDLSGELKPMPGALELVRHLHALTIPQAIGSSAPPENIPYILDALRISDQFDATVSRWEVEHGKPAPDIFLTAAGKIGVPPGRCVVLEDAPPGIAAAHAGGMRCVALVGTWPEDTLTCADYRVRTLSDILWNRETFAMFAAGTWTPLDSAQPRA